MLRVCTGCQPAGDLEAATPHGGRCCGSQRLPKAIQAILGNYRGARVGGIPEGDMRAVLIRLARAAWSEGRMPPRALAPAPAYQQLALVLDQLGLSEQIVGKDADDVGS